VLLIVNAVVTWQTDAQLERQLAAIREAGDPLTLADLAREPIPPDSDAAVYLRRAVADCKAIDKEIDESPDFLKYTAWAICPIPPTVQKKLRAVLDAYPKVVPLLEQAAACPDYNPEFEYTLPMEEFMTRGLDFAQDCRAFARVLHYRARLLAAEGNRDEAVRSALILFRLDRHFQRNPVLIGYLITLTIRSIAVDAANQALQTGPISKDVRLALDAELAIQERTNALPWALKSERAFMRESFRNSVPARNCWLVMRALWNVQESSCLDLFEPCLAMADNPPPLREVEKRLAETAKPNWGMAALAWPGMGGAFAAGPRSLAQVRSLRVVNALQTHVPPGSNETPKLGELGLPAETCTDPFTGEPLCVKKTPQGWIVYSVGRNYVDDGGKVEDPNDGDVGVGPPAAAKTEGK
jgi:hypothetical protein